MIVKSKSNILNKEAKITILTLLKNFYDEEIFTILIKDFYNSDIDISLAAIQSSSSIGNEIAVSHLYQLIEKGNLKQKLAAIEALAKIKAPSATNMLLKYYELFQEAEIRIAILEALNDIFPSDSRVIEINKTILLNEESPEELKECAIKGLIDTGELNFLKEIINKESPDIQRKSFEYILYTHSSGNYEDFFKFFHNKTTKFTPYTLGTFLAAYLYRYPALQQTYIIEKLQGNDTRAFNAFITVISQFEKAFPHPIKLFRLLLIAPFIDFQIEAVTGDLIQRVTQQIKQRAPHYLNELTAITQTHLDTLFAKVRKNFISLKGITEKEKLLTVVLANILERYANKDLLTKVERFFRSGKKENLSNIISDIRRFLVNAPKEDQNKFEACVSLFMLDNRKDILNIRTTLSSINLERPNLLRRLNRLIRVIGYLNVRNSTKKLTSILEFAKTERINYLAETTIVTLMQLLSRNIIATAKKALSSPRLPAYELKGYIRGSKYIPPNILTLNLLYLLKLSQIDNNIKLFIIEALKETKVSETKGALLSLVKILESTPNNDFKKEIGKILTDQGDTTVIQPLIDLTNSKDEITRIVAISILREISKKHPDYSRDIIINRLYILMESDSTDIRIEALITLIALGDDYAIQVLTDYMESDNPSTIAKLIQGLKPYINHEILKILFTQFTSDSPEVHVALRETMQNLAKGEYSEEIRKRVIELLKHTTNQTPKASVEEVTQPQTDNLINHAKYEFKFKRENSQKLTVMFIDIVGYTEKSSSSDMSNIIELIKNFEDITIPTIKTYKGTLIKKMGDGLLAIFKHPLNAVLASLEIQQKIAEYNELRVANEKFQARIGLNTGLVIRKDNDIYGDVVNVASRMETSANPGDILLTENTYNEVKEYIKCTKLGNIQVKGKKETIPAYSANHVAVNLENLMKEREETENKPTEINTSDAVINFKESLFSPKFEVSTDLNSETEIFKKLSTVFSDLTQMVEEIAENYHEEYIFKRYLQHRWDEILKSVEKENHDNKSA